MAAITKTKRDRIAESLADKEYRDAFVTQHVALGIAFQVRAMRVARGWTQKTLGERIGATAQAAVSRLEKPRTLPNVGTLLKVASAFDVALIVRFAPFGQLVDHAANIEAHNLEVPSFDEERAAHKKTEIATP